MSSEFIVVYDLLQAGFERKELFINPFFFLVIFIVSFLIKDYKPGKGKKTDMAFKVATRLMMFFSILLFITFLFFIHDYYSQYVKLKEKLINNETAVVEGVISNFIPMPKGGHADEKISISGAKFSYSDFSYHIGFNNTAVIWRPCD